MSSKSHDWHRVPPSRRRRELFPKTHIRPALASLPWLLRLDRSTAAPTMWTVGFSGAKHRHSDRLANGVLHLDGLRPMTLDHQLLATAFRADMRCTWIAVTVRPRISTMRATVRMDANSHSLPGDRWRIQQIGNALAIAIRNSLALRAVNQHNRRDCGHGILVGYLGMLFNVYQLHVRPGIVADIPSRFGKPLWEAVWSQCDPARSTRRTVKEQDSRGSLCVSTGWLVRIITECR